MSGLRAGVPLAEFTRFKTGGAAEYFFDPADAGELSGVLKNNAIRPITVLGMGSNVLVSDAGVRGLVIHAGRMSRMLADGPERDCVTAGAGAPLGAIAGFAAARGLAGFEFMAGIPGTAGGAVITNAGCSGGQMSGLLEFVRGVRFDGSPMEISAAQCGLGYRSSGLPPEFIITEMRLHADGRADSADIRQNILGIIKKKNDAQPAEARTAGSTFKNPAGGSAWRLIKDAFPDGLRIGGARISEKHANFIVAGDGATSSDILALIDAIRGKTALELEIKILK
jgi:UDP-N-acetylmuramate dehydrogenase